jgi:hypothetical protein
VVEEEHHHALLPLEWERWWLHQLQGAAVSLVDVAAVAHHQHRPQKSLQSIRRWEEWVVEWQHPHHPERTFCVRLVPFVQ